MKARLWQSLFLLNVLVTTEIIFAEDVNKDIRDLLITYRNCLNRYANYLDALK